VDGDGEAALESGEALTSALLAVEEHHGLLDSQPGTAGIVSQLENNNK
jgi:hypothetical protein